MTPFGDTDDYIALPRLSGLAISPQGDRLVTAVAELTADRTAHATALWAIDPTGDQPARRLTRSLEGEAGAAFMPDGDLLFASKRPDPALTSQDADAPAGLLLLPADGGEARRVADRPGGFAALAVARDAGTVVGLSPTLPGSEDADDDRARRKARKDLKIDAVLHTGYPVRYWDHDLGPAQARLVAGAGAAALQAAGEDPRLDLADLTPSPGRALDEADIAVAPDGSVAVTTWYVPTRGGRRVTVQAVDLGTGARRALMDDPDREAGRPSVSPDSARVAVVTEVMSTTREAPRFGLAVIDLASGAITEVDTPIEAAMSTPAWTPDGLALIVTADERGRAPVFRIEVATGATTRLTGDHGAYGDAVVAPDGRAVYAVRSAVDAAPSVVRLDPTTADQQPVALPGPAPQPALPGRLEEVTATAEDGTPLRAWLCLPAGASADAPAPFLLWIHGGPLLGSWNAWSWRWNPWLAVAQGYAVLLPDPALSTGYGRDFVQRGWGRWGAEPYTDLMAVTDAALERPDLDATRTAAMGGSFGGYMANWVAGHTDRFDAIVTHASLWALDQFGPTTDAHHYWRRELTPEMAAANSPHHHVDAITTPMLVIHGDKDYRVPIGDGLRLWAELAERHQGEDGELPHRFLLYPGEHHWILKPQHARLWYATVFAFLDWHVMGGEWVTPELLT